MVISFSMVFSRKLSKLLRGPSSLTISLRLFMSDLLTVLIDNVIGSKASRKIIAPMISFIQLLKLS